MGSYGVLPARNTAGDYADVLRKLLPRGRVWTREDEGTQAAVLDALDVTAEGIDSSALTLIAAGFPATADQLRPNGMRRSACRTRVSGRSRTTTKTGSRSSRSSLAQAASQFRISSRLQPHSATPSP